MGELPTGRHHPQELAAETSVELGLPRQVPRLPGLDHHGVDVEHCREGPARPYWEGVVTQDLSETFACDPRAAGETATARRKRVKLTPMGVLEILMWCAGAGAILGFWLWQRGADLPASGNAKTRGHSPTVAFSKAGTEMPVGVKLELWDERFRAATEPSVLWNADPPTTGSASLAPTVPDLTPLNHTRAPSPETSEAVVPRADEAAAGWMKNPLDEAEQPAESAKNDQNGRGLVVARLKLTSASAGQGATDADGATDPQISFPPEPPLLDLFGLPQFETASDFGAPL